MTVLEFLSAFLRDFTGQMFFASFVFSLSLKKRKYYWLLFILCLAFFILLYWIAQKFNLFSRLKTGWFTWLFILEYILSNFVLLVLCKIKWNEVLFYSSVAYSLQHLMYNIVIIVCWISNIPFDASWRSFAVQISVNIVIYTLAFFTIGTKIKKGEVENVNSGSIIVLSIVTLLITNVVWAYDAAINGYHSSLSFHLTQAFCIFFLLIIQCGLFDRSQIEKKNEIMSQILNVQKKESEISTENIEMLNIKCHDLKNQINALRNESDSEEIAKYIKSIDDSVSTYDSMAKTGNKDLDTILTQKALYCLSKKIQLDIIADGSAVSFMEASDVYSLIGNALDNAIEAVQNYPEDERMIGLKILKKDLMTIIHTENRIKSPIVFENGLPITKKEDKNYHGFGLKSIEFISKKYGGEIAISTENQTFSLNIMIPLNKQYLEKCSTNKNGAEQNVCTK
jgi:hypothetical protein